MSMPVQERRELLKAMHLLGLPIVGVKVEISTSQTGAAVTDLRV